MAEKPAAQAKKEQDPPAAPPLGAAGESTDPWVHQLLAHREIAILNGDEEAIQAINARLAEAGVK